MSDKTTEDWQCKLLSIDFGARIAALSWYWQECKAGQLTL